MDSFFNRPDFRIRLASLMGSFALALAGFLLGLSIAASMFRWTFINAAPGGLLSRAYGTLAFLIPLWLFWAAWILASPRFRPGRIFALAASLVPFMTAALGFSFIRDFALRQEELAWLRTLGRTGLGFVVITAAFIETAGIVVIHALFFSQDEGNSQPVPVKEELKDEAKREAAVQTASAGEAQTHFIPQAPAPLGLKLPPRSGRGDTGDAGERSIDDDNDTRDDFDTFDGLNDDPDADDDFDSGVMDDLDDMDDEPDSGEAETAALSAALLETADEAEPDTAGSAKAAFSLPEWKRPVSPLLLRDLERFGDFTRSGGTATTAAVEEGAAAENSQTVSAGAEEAAEVEELASARESAGTGTLSGAESAEAESYGVEVIETADDEPDKSDELDELDELIEEITEVCPAAGITETGEVTEPAEDTASAESFGAHAPESAALEPSPRQEETEAAEGPTRLIEEFALPLTGDEGGAEDEAEAAGENETAVREAPVWEAEMPDDGAAEHADSADRTEIIELAGDTILDLPPSIFTPYSQAVGPANAEESETVQGERDGLLAAAGAKRAEPRVVGAPVTARHKAKKQPGPYSVPVEGILNQYADGQYWIIDEDTNRAAKTLQETLKEFGIQAEVTGIRKGPVITMFEILPAPGVKLSKIVNLQDNIALRLAASSVRIVATIPGKHAVGIEVPNKKRNIVSFREIIEGDLHREGKRPEVPVVLGKDITGEALTADLTQMPHLLIAGSTGSGKSVCVNSMILSILYQKHPAECKLILIDPKIVELKLYNDIPHLLAPVITEPKKAFQALQYCIFEMERRYACLDSMGVRDIKSYNRRIRERNIAAEHMPYIVVVIDEFADLMATTGKELESTVARLAAMSRAVGIHLVLATQRPSIDVITGLIKANIPSRIAFMVASKMDSRIIIDMVGAEKLLGKGDMLYAGAVDPFPIRLQGTYVSEEEVEKVVEFVKTLGEPEYIDDEIFYDEDEDDAGPSIFSDGDDPLYEKALEVVLQQGKASASYLQRRLKIGYNRAARLVEEMEHRGVVGPAQGSKPRELLHIA
ncbi:MAG: cell division protein FtsK [Treponema sp.]|jgi:DNA segregation ATPase FtsK/SpoIIIE-like protein|nr:cell division protein FtsK [Treponema sp.]